ncbi:MAG: lipoyl(octanoyl) transferase LipB [Thermaerobacterales bacterium]
MSGQLAAGPEDRPAATLLADIMDRARQADIDGGLLAVSLGAVDYEPAWSLQRGLAAARARGQLVCDVMLLLEHPPTFTLGRHASMADIRWNKAAQQARGVRVIRIDRGGAVTFHGPGQLVGYPILHLPGRRLGVRRYIERLEDGLIAVLAGFGLAGVRHEKHPGIWVGDKKIAAIGIRCRRGVTTHGFALNVSTDVTYFAGIVPCAQPDGEATSMADLLGPAAAMETVGRAVERHLPAALGYSDVISFAPSEFNAETNYGA